MRQRSMNWQTVLHRPGEQAEKIINDVLHNYAGQEIISHVTPLIPGIRAHMERKKETGKGITAISGGTGEPVCRGQNKNTV